MSDRPVRLGQREQQIVELLLQAAITTKSLGNSTWLVEL